MPGHSFPRAEQHRENLRMSTIVEIIPEKLAEAEASLEALASVISGIEPPIWRGVGRGGTAAELPEATEALSSPGEALAGVCRKTGGQIRTVRTALTETDRQLAGE